MPNRILKESICTSEDINGLTWFEEVLFYRLIVNCDDFGRFYGNPSIVKGKLFPLKTVTNKQIDDGLNKLLTAGMVIRYESSGKPFLQLVTWDKHQHKRAKNSKFPKPEESACTCEQMQADVSENTRNEKREYENTRNEEVLPGAEPTPDISFAPFLTLPLNDGTEYSITDQALCEWQELYPAVDIRQELRNMKGWLLSNPKKRKTKAGILRFITNWLSREQDKGGKGIKPSIHPEGRNYGKDFYDGVLEESVEALKAAPKDTEPEEKDPMTEHSVIENYRKYLNPSLNSFEEEWLMQKVTSYGEKRVLTAMRQMLKQGERETKDLLRRLEEGA